LIYIKLSEYGFDEKNLYYIYKYTLHLMPSGGLRK
jgi:hypothetical protein